MHTGHNVHQRALAGAVLAAQRVHLAGAHVKSTPLSTSIPANDLRMPRISSSGTGSSGEVRGFGRHVSNSSFTNPKAASSTGDLVSGRGAISTPCATRDRIGSQYIQRTSADQSRIEPMGDPA